MRVIKFRAWDKGSRKIVYPEFPKYIQYDEGYTGFTNARIDYGTYEGNFELMQFTGLLDKNGKEIYEGDEIRVVDKHGNEDRGVLFYNEKEMAFVIDWGIHGYARVIDDPADQIEVIGHRYENPELLK